MKILEDLWYGNICPNEQGSFWTEECKDLLALFNRNSEKLVATLNEEEKATFEKMHDCWLEMQQYSECGAFIIGFRLGVQIMAASMSTPPIT